MKIMVTGVRGFLASRLCRYLQERRHEVTGLSHEQLDITSYEAVRKSLREISPKLVIHCAAISDVAACAENADLSLRVNVRGTENLARASGEMGIRLIYCSSDQIYFGSRGNMPHAEDEEVCPPHVYGRHKLLAEQVCRQANADSICLRLSLMYDKHIREGREHGNLLSNVLKAAQEKKPMSYPVYDFRSITDVWEVIRNMEKLSELPGGIYNFGSENDLSTFEIVKLILSFPDMQMYICKKTERRLRIVQGTSGWISAGCALMALTLHVQRRGFIEYFRAMPLLVLIPPLPWRNSINSLKCT